MIELNCSKHAEDRIGQRMGIKGKKQVKQLVKNAYAKGTCRTRGHLPYVTQKWVNRRIESYFGRASKWRVYRNHLFLFSRTLTLITVIEIPKEYLR